MTNAELQTDLDRLKDIMVMVSTSRERIDDHNQEYQDILRRVAPELARRNLTRFPFADLWMWYGRWSNGDLPSYQSRRTFLAELFKPYTEQIAGNQLPEIEPTGWPRVDRTVTTIREQFAAARDEEQFQAVGVMCREVLISVAQAVYDRAKHPALDGTEPSATDGKRMLEAFIAVELATGANDEARAHARSALALSLKLQHKRTASFRDAALCVEATTSVINLIAIISGRRDP